MENIYKFGAKSNINSLILLTPINIILALLISAFLENGKNLNNGGINSDVEITMSDTSELKRDEFFEESKDEFGTDKIINGYENLSSTSDSASLGEVRKITSEEQYRKTIEEQNRLMSEVSRPSPPSSPSRYSSNYEDEEYIISKKERKKEVPAQQPEPKRVGFNTVSINNTTNTTASKQTNNEGVTYKIESAMNQTLINGSKATFKTKMDIGDAPKGTIIYGKVIIRNNKLDIEFNGSQFGWSGRWYLYQGQYKGIDFANNENSVGREVEDEGRRQGSMIAGDIVSAIPIIGGAGSRIISRIGTSSGRQREISLELMKGEKFSISNNE